MAATDFQPRCRYIPVPRVGFDAETDNRPFQNQYSPRGGRRGHPLRLRSSKMPLNDVHAQRTSRTGSVVAAIKAYARRAKTRLQSAASAVHLPVQGNAKAAAVLDRWVTLGSSGLANRFARIMPSPPERRERIKCYVAGLLSCMVGAVAGIMVFAFTLAMVVPPLISWIYGA